MSAPIEITGTVLGAESVIKRFTAAAEVGGARAKFKAAVERLGLQLLANVKRDKLSGGVLGVRSGRLRRSINEKTVDRAGEITSTVGTNVAYARFWELGFSGVESVKAHLREGHPVRAFQRQVSQAPRPFLVPALNEMRSTIQAQLAGAAQEAV